MRIRTQLILAAFLLAVVPLAAIVGYSYTSSRDALEMAYRKEAERLTRQMDRRLAAIRSDIDQRLAVASSAMPVTSPSSSDVGDIVAVMGDASLVPSLEFQPVRTPAEPVAPVEAEEPRSAQAAPSPRPNPAPAAQTARAVPAPQRERPSADAPVLAEGTRSMASAEGSEGPAVPPVPPVPPSGPIVIHLPTVELPRFQVSEETQELIAEVGALGSRMNDPRLPPEDREDLRKEMQAAQETLRKVITLDRTRFQEQYREAQRIARAQRASTDARNRERTRGGGGAVVVGEAPAAPGAASNGNVNLSPAFGVTHGTTHLSVSVPASSGATGGKTAASSTPGASESSGAERRDASRTESARTETGSVRRPTATESAKSTATAKRTALILGRKFEAPVRSEGEVVGQLRANVSPEQVVSRILGTSDDAGELAFAIDREGNTYTRTQDERRQLDALGIPERVRNGKSVKGIEGWIVSTSTDPQSGLKIGVARPVGENLQELRRAAARNFGLGMGMIAFALIGMIPLTNHLTRDVKMVTEGAERIAHGDLMTRLPVNTKNELGQLARAFNRMAEDLSVNQQKLVEQERARKEQELQQRLMTVEYERKSVELEDARRFQLSMLPKEVPAHPAYEVAVFTRTATEVGGDYYDFHLADEALTVTIGDATGHGAKAGTMVTVVKTLFAAYNERVTPAEFLSDAAEKIKRMELGRMAMALSVARFEPTQMTLSSAGMPPAFVHRKATGVVEEVALAATPLGTMGVSYDQTSVPMSPGDTVLLMSDGFPELLDDDGTQLGYVGAQDAFGAAARAEDAATVIALLAREVRGWRGETAPNDDVTFVVIRALG
jgi:serine phosphatase RsbU (regulator of sigma subunit)